MKYSLGRKQKRRFFIKGFNKPSSKHYRKPHVFTCEMVQLYNEQKRGDRSDENTTKA